MNRRPAAIEHLYVHVPFCAVKCNYCAFYSEAGHAQQMAGYVDAARRELDHWRSRLRPQTIFFGGGTPSLLPLRHLERLLAAAGQLSNGNTSAVAEFTVECNPATVSAAKARLLRDHGVNRISMGVQTLDDGLLKKIGRLHSRAAALRSYDTLRTAGFENINLDLMFGLPGQTRDMFRQTLTEIIALQPEHISTYCLILEEDTVFWSLFQQGLLLPNEEEELALYELALETLAAAGYAQYEISNFAKPGRACAHNIAYWEGRDYLGIGPGACSTVGARRWQNVPDINAYLASLAPPANGRGHRPAAVSSEETITPDLRAAERAAFGMRMNAGVPAALVRERWAGEIAELLSGELVYWRDGRLRPTRRGLLFADQVAAEFV